MSTTRGEVATSVPLGLVAAAVAVVGVLITGAAAPLVLADPGPVVRWGLPVVTAIADLGASLTIGLLVLAATALPVSARRAYLPALQWVAAAAGVWAVAAVAQLVLGYAAAGGTALDDPDFGRQLVSFVRYLDLGRALALTATIAAVVALLAAGVRSLAATGWLLLVSLVGLVPPSLTGHVAGAGDHETAVTALGAHLLGVTVWAGGLIGLVLLWRRLPEGDARYAAVQRFSPIAGWCFALVAVSGVINGALRVGSWSGLASSYGVVLVLKSVVLVGLGLIGWRHRRSTLPQVAAGRPRAFERLAGVEALLLASAIGLGAALSRSAPPQSAIPPANPTRAQSLTGYLMPPSPTALRWVTLWQPDLLWLALAVLAAGWYLAAVRLLRRRGDHWSLLRTASWLVGCAVLIWTTSGAPAAYGRVSFSGHMLGHMVLGLVVPMLLVPAAPITLVLRTTTARRDGTRGVREWVLVVVESRLLSVLCRPAVAATLFVASLVVFYNSGLFELALRTHVGHELMHLHFLLVGYLFVSLLVGIDPLPYRAPYPMRLVILLATMAFHALFGVALMMGRTVMAAGYFGPLARPWGADLLLDQQFGGGIAWGAGDLPTLVLAMVLAVQWAGSDAREARRSDRAADRNGDADLLAYNAMLGRLSGRDRQGQP